MPRSLIRQLRTLMPFTVLVRPLLSKERFGEETHGPEVAIKGRLRDGNVIVKNSDGQEVVSKTQFWAAGVFGLTADDLYTLPAPFTPAKPQAIAVILETDEHGVHHEKVMF